MAKSFESRGRVGRFAIDRVCHSQIADLPKLSFQTETLPAAAPGRTARAEARAIFATADICRRLQQASTARRRGEDDARSYCGIVTLTPL
jgi:hypothetical protein